MSDALRMAFGTLTTWKVPPPREITPRVAGRAMLLAPLVMLPLLTVVALPLWLLWLVGYTPPPAVLAAVLMAVHVLSTRGMHLDGIADTADGLSASYDRTRALEVMKSSDIGPSGVAAIALALAVQITALAHLAANGALLTAGVAVLASRQSLAWSCHRRVPAATPSGLGATVAGSVSTVALGISTLMLFTVGIAASLASGLSVVVTVAPVVAAIAATLVLLARCRSRLGGITGDVLGAGVELSFTAALAAAALAVA